MIRNPDRAQAPRPSLSNGNGTPLMTKMPQISFRELCDVMSKYQRETVQRTVYNKWGEFEKVRKEVVNWFLERGIELTTEEN